MSGLSDLDPALCNYTGLRKASRRVSLVYDRALAPSGLTTAQFGILVEIAQTPSAPGVTLTGLADRLVMDRAALTQSLKPLLASGLVSVGPDPADGRTRRVLLTQIGGDRLALAHSHWAQAQAAFGDALGEDEAIALRALLRLVLARVKPPIPGEPIPEDSSSAR